MDPWHVDRNMLPVRRPQQPRCLRVRGASQRPRVFHRKERVMHAPAVVAGQPSDQPGGGTRAKQGFSQRRPGFPAISTASHLSSQLLYLSIVDLCDRTGRSSWRLCTATPEGEWSGAERRPISRCTTPTTTGQRSSSTTCARYMIFRGIPQQCCAAGPVKTRSLVYPKRRSNPCRRIPSKQRQLYTPSSRRLPAPHALRPGRRAPNR